jgi:hypothetical protein
MAKECVEACWIWVLGALGLHIEVGTEEVDTVVGSGVGPEADTQDIDFDIEVGREADTEAAGNEVGIEVVAGADCWSIHLASLYPC